MRKSNEEKLAVLARAGKGDGNRHKRLRERVAGAASDAVEKDEPYASVLSQEDREEFGADNASKRTETQLGPGQDGPWGVTEKVPISSEPTTFEGTGGWMWVDNGDGSFTVAEGQQGAGTKYAAGSSVAAQVAREREHGADQAPEESAAPANTAAALIEAAAPAATPYLDAGLAMYAGSGDFTAAPANTAAALIETAVGTPEARSWWDTLRQPSAAAAAAVEPTKGRAASGGPLGRLYSASMAPE
jgi:hypothetical protein